jgi:catechol 2,3-dioxygenase-like lactoylglutathione lyase family enzyme
MKIEIVAVPVSDVDRTKRFYKALGWREDADFVGEDDFRIVQLTPPGSPTSIHFGNGVPAGTGSLQGMYLVVPDIDTARAELIEHGVEVSQVFHDAGGLLSVRADTSKQAPGADPNRRSYASFATFADPDGNGWIIQEITTRLPGR